jgi:hypothetical protein
VGSHRQHLRKSGTSEISPRQPATRQRAVVLRPRRPLLLRYLSTTACPCAVRLAVSQQSRARMITEQVGIPQREFALAIGLISHGSSEN